MRILVTGATGVVGTEVVDQLHTAGHPVTPVARRETDASLVG